jgi:hypothetical protein
MKKALLILLAALGMTLSSFANAAEARPEIARYVKAYAGNEGVKVWTLRIGPVEKNEAIVQIAGIDHPWDMRIQKMQTEPSSRGTNYVATVDGKRFVVLVMNESSGELYLPSTNKTVRIGYSKSLSEEGNAEHFLTDFLEKKKPSGK